MFTVHRFTRLCTIHYSSIFFFAGRATCWWVLSLVTFPFFFSEMFRSKLELRRGQLISWVPEQGVFEIALLRKGLRYRVRLGCGSTKILKLNQKIKNSTRPNRPIFSKWQNVPWICLVLNCTYCSFMSEHQDFTNQPRLRYRANGISGSKGLPHGDQLPGRSSGMWGCWWRCAGNLEHLEVQSMSKSWKRCHETLTWNFGKFWIIA